MRSAITLGVVATLSACSAHERSGGAGAEPIVSAKSISLSSPRAVTGDRPLRLAGGKAVGEVAGRELEVSPAGLELRCGVSKLRLRAARIVRANASIFTPSSLTLHGSELRLGIGDIVESIRPASSSLEQSWSFMREPSGAGDLRVDLAIEHGTLREVDRGAAITTSEGCTYVYGHGTWVEASGHRTPVPVRVEGDHLALTVPASVLRASAYPAVLDPTLSVETVPVPSTTTGAPVRAVAAAHGAGMFLAAFVDAGSQLRFSRFDAATGTNLDPSSVLLTAHDTPLVRVAWDGTSFVVLWMDAVTETFVARPIRPDGTLGTEIQLGAVPYPGVSGGNWAIDLAAAGSQLLAGWSFAPFSASIPGFWGVRFLSDGTVLDATPRGLGPNGSLGIGLFPDGGSGWMASSCRGIPAGYSYIPGGALQTTALRTDGTATGAWTELHPSCSPLGAAFSPLTGQYLGVYAGKLGFLSTAGAPVGTTAPLPFGTYGSLEWEGSRWLLLLTDGTVWKAVHATTAPAIVETTPIALPAGIGQPLASDATNLLFASGPNLVFVSRSTFTETRRVPIQRILSTMSSMSAASIGAQTLMVWTDDREPRGSYAIRLDANGVPLDSAPKFVDVTPQPRVAAGMDRFYVTTAFASTPPQSTFSIVTTSGSYSAATPLSFEPKALWFDGTYPVALTSSPGFVRLKPDGTAIASGALVGSEHSIAAQPGGMLVAFRRVTGSNGDVFLDSIDPGGVSLGEQALGTSTTADEYQPVVASSETSSWAAFLRRVSGGDSEIVVTRVRYGKPTGLLTVATGKIASIKMAADASGLTVVYHDTTIGLRVLRVSGVVATASVAATVFASAASAVPYAVTAPMTGKSLVLYSDGRTVTARTVSFSGDNGSACTSSAQCESGYCVDSVCCASDCTQQCEACDNSGLEGSCTPTVGKPHGTRAACTGIASGTDCGIQCLGTDRTSCGVPASGTTCGVNACIAGSETHVGTCDGSGNCSDMAKSCGGFACVGAVCGTSCLTSSECLTGFHCKDNKCIPVEGLGKPCTTGGDCATGTFCTEGVCCEAAACGAGKTCASPTRAGTCAFANGQACSLDEQCGSAHCVDGVCCESSCSEQCAACDLPGTMGKCLAVRGKPHGARTRCASDEGNVCASLVCDGANTTACVGHPGEEVVCQPRACTSATLTEDGRCDGAGACAAGASASCGGYQCATTSVACRTTCDRSEDCVDGFVCRAGRCEAVASQCSADGTRSVATKDGAATRCLPFACNPAEGTCRFACTSAEHCAAGYLCTSAGECEPAAPQVVDDGGCSYGASRRPVNTLLLMGLALVFTRSRPRGARPAWCSRR